MNDLLSVEVKNRGFGEGKREGRGRSGGVREWGGGFFLKIKKEIPY